MSEPKTMNHIIHDAVRRDFDRLVSALGSFSPGDRERAQGLNRAYANLCSQLTHHHQGEDRWVWPMLSKVGVDADLLATMEAEHHAMATALTETTEAMNVFAASASASDATLAHESVLRTNSVVESHLAHEEQELEPQLIPHFQRPEWKAVEKKLSRLPPQVAGPFFAWLTDGISSENRAVLRSEVPAPVVSILSGVFGRSYNKNVAPVWRQVGTA